MGQVNGKSTKNQVVVRENIHYSFVPNHRETMEALARAKFTCQEFRMVLALLNRTDGRLEEEAELTSASWQALTLLSRQHVHSTLQGLLSLKVIGAEGRRYRVNHPNGWDPKVFRPQRLAGRAIETLRTTLQAEKEKHNFRWLSALLTSVPSHRRLARSSPATTVPQQGRLDRPAPATTAPEQGRPPGPKSVPGRGRKRPPPGTVPSLPGDGLGGTTGGDEKRREISTPSGEGVVRRKGRTAPDPRVREIQEAMGAEFGFPEKTEIDPIPTYGKEGRAIKRMLARGFTPERILAVWRGKVKRRGGQFVSMVYVNEDIGKEVMRGEPGGHPAAPGGKGFDFGGLPDTGIDLDARGARGAPPGV